MPLPLIEPMLATTARGPLPPEGWVLEPKLDGWRAMAFVDGTVTVRTRTGRDVSATLPGLTTPPPSLLGRRVVLDGELVAGDGRASDFYRLAPRMALGAERAPSGCRVTFVAFDVLHLDGRDRCSSPYAERRRLLEELELGSGCWHTVPQLDADLAVALDACQHLELEGVVAKRLDGRYRPGRRSPDWVKHKTAQWRAVHAERRREPA